MNNGIPPHSNEAERGVLGSIFRDKNVLSKIDTKSEYFYTPAHSLIFETMIELRDMNKPIDFLTVGELLKDKNILESVGGNMYLIDLTNTILTSGNIKEYADIVYKKWLRRRIIQIGHEIMNKGYKEQENPEDSIEEAKNLLNIEIKRMENKVNLDVPVPFTHGNQEIDKIYGRINYGDTLMIIGEAGSGKTTFAIDLIIKQSKKYKSAFLSLEMGREQLIYKDIRSNLKISQSDWDDRKFTEEMKKTIKYEKEKWESRENLHITDMSNIKGSSLGSVTQEIQKLHRQGFVYFIIDNFDLINAKSKDNNERCEIVSKTLKSLAMELNIGIVILHHYKKRIGSDTGPRGKDDFRGSGKILDNTDWLVQIHREDPSIAGEKWETNNKVAYIIEKNRMNGPTGMFKLGFKNGKYYTLTN